MKRMLLGAKIFLLFIMLLLCYNPLYAQGLTAKEAVNYFNQAVKAQEEGNYSEAKVAYKKTALLDPYNPEWQKFIGNNMGIIYVQEGNLEQAEAAFDAVLNIDPDYQPAKLNLGLVYDLRRTRLESLEYWADLFNWEEQKPRDFILEEQKESSK